MLEQIFESSRWENLDVHHYGLYNGLRLIILDYRIARIAGMKISLLWLRLVRFF